MLRTRSGQMQMHRKRCEHNFFPERVVENMKILRTRSVQRKIPQRVLSKLIFTERVLGER